MKKQFLKRGIYIIFCNLISITYLLSMTLDISSNNQIDEYKVVWEDNFESTVLDKSKWNIEVNGNGGGNRELQYYTEKNISIGNESESGASCLIITAKKESYLGKNCTSGRIRTYGKMSFKYGKVESRIKLPKTANGLWPAFWLLGADYPEIGVGWPKCGEIDIMEMGNSYGITNNIQERYFNGWFHWGEAWTPNGYPNWGKDIIADYSLQDDFHLYTLVWDTNSIKMYLDLDKFPENKPYVEMNISGSTEPGQVGRYYHKPFNIILNLAIGGNFTGIWDINEVSALNEENNFEAKMYVDYVKVYQKGVVDEEINISSSTSLDNITSNRYYLEPNPASNILFIKGDKTPFSITIYDLLGTKKLEVQNTDQVDISSLTLGNYIVKITISKDIFETHKLSKVNYSIDY